MLYWAAEVVRLAYGAWPSYGGAFVLVSLLVGVLFAPLTIRSARSRQQLALLRPELLQLQATHVDDSAARGAAIMALYRSHGVRLGSIFSLAVLQWAAVVVLYLVVLGFARLDPGNGGGPDYLEPGTTLWQSVKDSGGQLTSFGVDLGKTLFTQGSGIGALSYTMMLIFLIVVTLGRSRIATQLTAAQGILVAIGALAISAIIPGAVVLYLVTLTSFNWGIAALTTTTEQRRLLGRWQSWQTPHREFQAQLREADRLIVAGLLDEAATLRLSAITEFSRKSSTDRLVQFADDIHHSLVAAAARRPSDAVTALGDLNRHCSRCVSLELTSSVVREWARSLSANRFGDDLATIETVLPGTGQDILDVLLRACRSVSVDELSTTFRRGASRYLWTHLDRSLRLTTIGNRALDAHNSAFALLDLVGPAHLSRAAQLCALGDLALARTSPAEALARYDAAVKRGSPQARERLAYQHAREGHRLLSAGQFASARRKFSEACELHQDPEYALLGVIAEYLSADTDTRVTIDKLEALKVSGALVPYRTLWWAIVHLRRGEHPQAAEQLRELRSQHSDITQRWGPVEEGAVLLSTLEGNDQDLLDWGRRLVRTYGRQWLSAGPSDPWPLVAAVARNDRDLLAEMVALVGSPRELPGWVRLAGAHALLVKSVERTRHGQVGAATSDVELAQRLLRG